MFAGFFLMCLWALYRRGFDRDDPSFYHRVLFCFMICFLVLSGLHELMYTRFLWFALGLGVSVPLFEKVATEDAEV